MNLPTAWLPRSMRFGAISALSLMVACGLLWSSETKREPIEATHQVVCPSEQATPDSDGVPADPFPTRQRAAHLAKLGADRWHAAGYRGQNVKVAILDSGFRGYRAHLGKSLPAQVRVRSFRSDGDFEAKDSQHGILCAEVLHALAPQVEIFLANWDSDRPDQFLDAVRWARKEGARVVSCSVIMPSWSDGEGGGIINDALAGIIGPGHRREDLLCFACAGNTAQRHWHGSYRRGSDGCHEWQAGQTKNPLTPWGNGRVSVELYTSPGVEYDLSVTDGKGEPAGTCASHHGSDRSCTVVYFVPQPDADYQVQVRLRHGKGGSFHLVVLGGSLSIATAQGSISCPADNPAVLAVGAVNSVGRRFSYSSCGPNSRRKKPDFVAPVPFPSQWRDRPFSGTSAAAPQAAALAALWLSRHPDWTAEQVRNALRSAAHDLETPGHDWETGFGLISLPALERKNRD